MKTFKLHLIRHGMTAGNLQGLYIGSGTDIPLCDEGRAQLNELKERFEYPQVDTVFSSPLLRAVETANILFPDAKHTFTVHDLREAGFGKFENKPVKELVHDEDFKKWITPGSGYVPEGAEPTDQFHARCAESLMKLFEYMIRMDVTEAACVTHGGVIMSMLSQRAAACRQVQGEHRSIRRVLAVERRSKAAAAHRLAIAHSGNAGSHTVQVAKRAHLTALQIACAHRQGGCGEVFHREIHQHIAHFLRRGIAQQLHGSFAVQQGRFACKTRLLCRCRYAGEQRCRKADRTGAGTFQK